jgi:hypothetical protein
VVTPLRPFFRELFARDGAGARWLPALLAATPLAAERLGELAAAPGWLQSQLALRTQSGSLGAFEYPGAAPRELLRWYIGHPDRLTWPGGGRAGSGHVERLRRALVLDEPAGARARAQERANEMIGKSSSLSEDWWRFEAPALLDCVLVSERIVITVVDGDAGGLGPATPWYPPRTRLVHDLEAARHLAAEEKRYATLVLSDQPLDGAADEAVASALPAAAPHLDEAARAELHQAYLGNVTWAAAAESVGVDLSTLPPEPEQIESAPVV